MGLLTGSWAGRCRLATTVSSCVLRCCPAAAQYHMPFAGRMLAPPYGRSWSSGAFRTQSAQRAGMRSAIITASA
jgi:hypothetical protein